MDGENTAEGKKRRRHPGLWDVSYVQPGNSLAQGSISLRISPGAVLCSGKREKTLKGEKSLLSLAGAGELNKTQLSPVCKDLFFTEGRGALWLYIMFVSPHLRRCISGDFAADCALCIQRKETSWMPFPPMSTHRRAEVRADSNCSAQGCRKMWPFP